ncbi:hypothetical protein [Streptomyces sp. NPDC048665]|uniref:hypothetical protein n=1 Tax=unclassified Streptomyces TaxID=2593676 RepID=UPI00341AEE69
MASRASSDTGAARGQVGIPSLPRLGTAWYERGTRYWLCRARIALGLLVASAIVVFFSLSLYDGFTSEWSPAARTTSYWVQAAGSCVAVVWGWLKQRRDHRAGLLAPPSPAESLAAMRAHKRRAPGLSVTGRGLVLILAPVMPMVAAWCVGWFLAYATVREYPSEAGARRWFEEHSTGS